jgi:hypothetical protein
MIIQKYVDCKICRERFAVCYVDDERKEATFYPMDYLDRLSKSVKTYELNVKQMPNPEKPDQKRITIPCPLCGYFSIDDVPYDWSVDVGSIEVLASIQGLIQREEDDDDGFNTPW